jgi:hypothetical protein
VSIVRGGTCSCYVCSRADDYCSCWNRTGHRPPRSEEGPLGFVIGEERRGQNTAFSAQVKQHSLWLCGRGEC